MQRLVIGICLWLALLACGGSRAGRAPTLPDGSRIAIMVSSDRNITSDMAPDRVEQINQLAAFMESDLLQILEETGYAPLRIDDPATPPGSGRYLLKVMIRNYKAGSKAARILVGFGAGAAVLDTHFELLGAGGQQVVSGDPSVGTGRDWKNAVRKVNLQTVDAINGRLSQR